MKLESPTGLPLPFNLRKAVGGVIMAISVCVSSLGAFDVFSAEAHAATAKAVVVSLTNCKQVDGPKDGEEGDFATLRCAPTVGGWIVQIDYDDARESITLIRAGKLYPLDLWRVVDGRFSSVGDRFEFRVVNGKPTAGIVRFSHVIDDSSTEKVSNLVVVKLSPTPCVVRVVPPSAGASQNTQARKLADRASSYSCIS